MAWQQPLYFEIVYAHVASKKQEYHSTVFKTISPTPKPVCSPPLFLNKEH